MAASTTILIAHAQEVFRAGLASMLAKPGIKIVGEATNVTQAASLAKRLKPAVLILDAALPGGDCFEFVRKLAKPLPTTRCIVMAAIDNPTYVARSQAVGAVNFLSAGATADDILQAIDDAVTGRSPSGKGPFGRVSAVMGGRMGSAAAAAGLTPREQQVLAHIAYGLPNEEIACSLGISVETVKEHVQNVLRKLAVRDRTQAAVWAVKSGAT